MLGTRNRRLADELLVDAVPVSGEPGSFRDPASRVFYRGGEVHRALTLKGLEDWRALESSSVLSDFTGNVVRSELVDESLDGIASALGIPAVAVLRHETIPFVSYPYEWAFGMLRDAAVLQLELLLAALEADLILKDATPYNVQWRGSQPVFVDVGSFERLRDDAPWVAYRQFCMEFLNPLLLRAHRGISFQPLLRGNLRGITPTQAWRTLGRTSLFRRGVFTHVFLHSRLEGKHATSRSDVRADLRQAGFNRQLIRANAQKLLRIVRALDDPERHSGWTSYGEVNSYSPEDAEAKLAFVRDACSTDRWDLAWDLGSNDGRFSRIAAEHARYVVAVDSDPTVVDALYRSLRKENARSILPLSFDLADPSPGLGWRGLERKPLTARGTPDLILCLAVVHHLSISDNVPVHQFLDWLRETGAQVVLEFPTEADEMVAYLARRRGELPPDYSVAAFEAALTPRFSVERRQPLPTGRRILYVLHPRP